MLSAGGTTLAFLERYARDLPMLFIVSEVELRPSAFYRDHAIELMAGERVVAIDPPERRVRTAAGRSLPYDALVLAVGARNRELPVDGVELDGVLSLRTLDQSIAKLGGASLIVTAVAPWSSIMGA